MNFRYYVTILFKRSDTGSDHFYQKLKSTNKDYEIIEKLLHKVISPRLTKNSEDFNKFYFETLEIQDKSLERVLNDLFLSFPSDYNWEYCIVDKDNPNIPVVDYVNFILNKLLTKDATNNSIPDWLIRAFEVVKDKIALIHFQNDDSFYSRHGKENREITLENIIKKKAGD